MFLFERYFRKYKFFGFIQKMKYLFGIKLVIFVFFVARTYGQSNSSSVQLTVNYESLCSDSIEFFSKQLDSSVKLFGKELEIKLIPWGKANVSLNNFSDKINSFIF